MRVLTRLTATLLTAGALIAPATMPAAHAATPTATVKHIAVVPTDTVGTFVATPTDLAGQQALRPGQPLTIINAFLSAEQQLYTLTGSDGSISRVTIQRGLPGLVTVPGVITSTPPSGVTYRLTSTSGAFMNFVAA